MVESLPMCASGPAPAIMSCRNCATCSLLAAAVRAVVDFLREPKQALDLPLDLRGTAFQQRVWRTLCTIPAGETRTYAQLFTSYVIYCNRSGFEDGVGFWGGSRVVGPDGTIVGSVPGADETVLYHTLERSALRRARVAYPLLRDERNDVNDAETDRLRRRRARD